MRTILLVTALCALTAGAATREELMQADRNFCKTVAERGVDGWVDSFAEDGKMFPIGRDVIEGKKAIRELMTARFAQPGFLLRWTPLGAEIAPSGDFGYTYGKSESRFLGKDGKTMTTEGRYITVWKKDISGVWKVTADIGNSTPPKPAN